MTPLRRKAFRLIPVFSLCTAAVMSASAHAQDVAATLDNAAHLLGRAFKEAKDSPIGESREAGQIISALRSSKDKDLLPLFEKLRQSTVPENQLYAMIAEAVITKDPQHVDLKLLLSNRDPQLIAAAVSALLNAEDEVKLKYRLDHTSPAAVAALADSQILTNDQLQQIFRDAADPTIKTIAVQELDFRKALQDHGQILQLLKSDKESVRYCAALVVLRNQDAAGDADALKVLHDLSIDHNLQQAAIESLMITQIQQEDIKKAGQWVAEVAADEKNDEGLRYTAIGALLALKHPQGPPILASMIQSQRDTIQQVKLGLISLEYGSQLKPEILNPIVQSHSTLVSTIGSLAQQAARGVDITAGLVKLIKQGHPIVLDWSLNYSDRAQADRRIALLGAIIGQSTIVDETRGRDYERAAIAAEQLVELDGKDGRALASILLKSGNRAVVEAVLAGIYRSTAKNQSELVLPVWDTLRKTKGSEMAANYGALIMAREGHPEVSEWLSSMVLGATIQNPGLRGLAGWYYAKLQGKTAALVQQVVAG